MPQGQPKSQEPRNLISLSVVGQCAKGILIHGHQDSHSSRVGEFLNYFLIHMNPGNSQL